MELISLTLWEVANNFALFSNSLLPWDSASCFYDVSRRVVSKVNKAEQCTGEERGAQLFIFLTTSTPNFWEALTELRSNAA